MKVRNIKTNESLFAIAIRKNGEVSYQVLDGETWTPYWLQFNELIVEDPSIPDQWKAFNDGSQTIITFPEFSTKGFWEKYFDANPSAVELYESVVVPTAKIEIKLKNILAAGKPTWSNLQWLIKNKFCVYGTAIELAIHELSQGSDKQPIIELAGLSPSEGDSIEHLVNRLAQSDSMNTQILVAVGSKWQEDCYPNAYVDVFQKRWGDTVKNSFSTD